MIMRVYIQKLGHKGGKSTGSRQTSHTSCPSLQKPKSQKKNTHVTKMPANHCSTLFLSNDESTKYNNNVAQVQEHLVAVKRL